MTGTELTLGHLTQILRQAAGQDEAVDLDGGVLDTTFEELGYDSLALLETYGRIERERDIELADSTIDEAKTPRALLAIVNAQIAARCATGSRPLFCS